MIAGRAFWLISAIGAVCIISLCFHISSDDSTVLLSTHDPVSVEYSTLEQLASKSLPSSRSLDSVEQSRELSTELKDDRLRRTMEMQARLDEQVPLASPSTILSADNVHSVERQARTQSLVMTPRDVMKQLNKIQSSQGRFHYTPVRDAGMLGRNYRRHLRRGLSPVVPITPPDIASNNIDAIQHRFGYATEREGLFSGSSVRHALAAGVPLPPGSMPFSDLHPTDPAAMSNKMAMVQGLQQRFQFAPERDALYGGQAYRAA
eukprot:CAMPEP_0113692494 /NCGR_PEP_ID=MMETSP0038_2-20120614/19112_1 /TAXON_ID=2898 /ORGANISM="Cryptomonas paramecium" /LENGTH=261 /DNA_ID=CAMNT_0000614405 /DNA_START=10 /DNA_END=791 /DNA_ORIENTATION=- /assembly_acc=CAM_ASM_000170